MSEFIIFWILFTIDYALSLIIYDRVSSRALDRKIIKKAFAVINVDSYHLFAKFYEIDSVADIHVLQDIYLHYRNQSKIMIEDAVKQYPITSYEFVIIYLYLEYLNLFKKSEINLQEGLILPITLNDTSLLNKYQSFFNQKASIQTVASSYGEVARHDLSYMNTKYLCAGVRFENDTLLYVGDLSENQ